MATKYIRVKVNSLVKSDQTTKRIIDFDYVKTYGDSVSTAEISLKRTNTTEDDADFVTGKPVQVWMSDALVTGQVAESSANIVFDGYIEDRDIELFKITLKCADRIVLTKWSETGVKYEYGVDTSVKTIFAALVDLAESETGKTINLSTDATATVPVNLNRYSTENNNIYEKLWELSNIVNWQFYYDPSDTYVAGGCIRFEPRGTPVDQSFYNKAASTGSPLDQNGKAVTWSGKTVNIAGLIGWQSDSKDLTNNLNVVGGQMEVTVSSEHHTVTLGTTNYVLSDTNAGGGNTNTQIFNLTVVADPGAVTLTQGVHYVVYVSASPPGFINFPVAPSTLGYTDLYFTYTYKFSASAGKSSSNAGSITSYIKRSKTVNKRDIISPTDISSYLTTLLGSFKDPISEVSFESRDSLITPIVGSLASIYDGIIGRVLISTGTPVPIITRSVKHWPQPTTTVTVSTKPLKYENQTQTYFDRIDKTDKELTATNAKPFYKMDGSTPIQGDVTFGKKSDGSVRELKTPVIHKLSTAPTALTEAQLYYNTTDHLPYFWNNSAWTSFSVGGTIGGSGTTNYLSKFTAGTTIGDSVLFDNATGTVEVRHASPQISLTNAAGSTTYSYWAAGAATMLFGSPVGNVYIFADGGSKSIILQTQSFDRLTIADAAITAAVDIAMGGKTITGIGGTSGTGNALNLAGASTIHFNDGGTIDFYGYRKVYANATGTDKFLRLGTGNAAENATLDRITISGAATTAVVKITNATLDVNGSLYLIKNHATENTSIVDDANGTMEFTVPSGQKFKFVVSA